MTHILPVMAIITTLKKLGLSEKESDTYLDLLTNGLSSASALAARVAFPRQTVYSILEKLIAEGFVEQSDKRGVKHFLADPDALRPLLEKKKRLLEDSARELDSELPKLLAGAKSAAALPKIRYYEGENGLKRLFENILTLYQKGLSHTFRGYGINSFHQFLGDYLYEFVTKRGECGVATKLFIADAPDDFSATGDTAAQGRDIKRIDMAPQEAGMYMAGDSAYLFSYVDNVGVKIENKAIVQLLKTVFDDHWKKSQ